MTEDEEPGAHCTPANAIRPRSHVESVGLRFIFNRGGKHPFKITLLFSLDPCSNERTRSDLRAPIHPL
ncbi:MAG: hypothetical protein ACI89E_001593 [Planctomycetota bacterium]|jgi:hypothetical protein